MKSVNEKSQTFSEMVLHLICLVAVLFYVLTSREPIPAESFDPVSSPEPEVTSVLTPSPSPTISVEPTASSVPTLPVSTQTPEDTPVPFPTCTASPTPSPTPTGIAAIHINTEESAPITSKLEYVNATMEIDGEAFSLQIKGRGNSSWNSFPKKSYRIKLDEKAALLGLPADKDFSLACNYVDPTLIRNAVTYDMSKVMTNLSWTPDFRFCELYINDEYLGIYTIHEKIEASKHKLDLGTFVTNDKGKILEGGFVIEWGWDYDCENVYGKDYFMTTSRDCLYVKEPKVLEPWDPGFRYAYDYVKAAEKEIENHGDYEKYIDVDNWVDWFIINELTNNTECSFYRSLYMYKQVDGKLCLGPLWDYDTAFGNHTGDIKDYNGWVSCDSTYQYMLKPDMIYYLLLDDNFCNKIKKRWAEVKDPLLTTALSSIAERSNQIADYRDLNFDKWKKIYSGSHIGSGRSTTYGFKTYDEQLTYLRDFVVQRYNWMDARLSSGMPIATPKPSPTPEPTPEPTSEPTPEPTSEPTPVPTLEPSPEPTPVPEVQP